MKIRTGNLDDLDMCAEILRQSELGRKYYVSPKMIKFELSKAIKEDLFRVVIQDDIVVGFMWAYLNGTFGRYPYLHEIVISESERGKGFGTALLNDLETCIKSKMKTLSTQIYLVVSDFNKNCMNFYSKLGYEDIGKIPGLFHPKINENVMRKKIMQNLD